MSEVILFVMIYLAVCMAIFFAVLTFFIYFIAGGNWLEEEQQYVRWRHYAGVKLKLIKPVAPPQEAQE